MEKKMKKGLYILLAVILAVGFASLGYGHVSAGVGPIISNGPQPADPTAAPAAAGATLTSQVLPLPVLLGTHLLDSGKYEPVGYKTGEVQFGGSGLKVSGLTGAEKAKVCFAFPSYRYKWDGKVNQWNGTKWVPLLTTFTKDVDGVVDWACTSAGGNGTYSLIIWYYGPPEAPYEPIPEPV
jgi:hypothetical protein